MAAVDDIPEREVKEFKFKATAKIKVGENFSTLSEDRRSLLVISNVYGLVFVGYEQGVRIFRTSDLQAIGDSHKFSETIAATPLIDIGCPSPPSDLSLSCDDLTLSVSLLVNGEQFLTLYDVRQMLKGSLEPFGQLRLASPLYSLRWNPTNPDILAYCLRDGSLTLATVKDTFTKLGEVPDAKACSLCWSPKGKQLVAGRSDGRLVQYDHEAKEKAQHVGPDYFTRSMRVSDVLWVSSHVFVTSHSPEPADPVVQPQIVITTTAKNQPPAHVNYEDICYGADEERAAHYFLTQIPDWELAVCMSAKAQEVALLGKGLENKNIWELWTLDDTCRAELPLDHEDQETFPLGLAIDTTARTPIDIGDNRTHPASPVLYLMTTDGLLCPFHMMYEGKAFQPTAPIAVPDGVRAKIGLVDFGGSKRPVAAVPEVSKPQPAASATTSQPSLFGGLSSNTGTSSSTGNAAAFSFGGQKIGGANLFNAKTGTENTAPPQTGFGLSGKPFGAADSTASASPAPFSAVPKAAKAPFSFGGAPAQVSTTPRSPPAPVQTPPSAGFSFGAPKPGAFSFGTTAAKPTTQPTQPVAQAPGAGVTSLPVNQPKPAVPPAAGFTLGSGSSSFSFGASTAKSGGSFAFGGPTSTPTKPAAPPVSQAPASTSAFSLPSQPSLPPVSKPTLPPPMTSQSRPMTSSVGSVPPPAFTTKPSSSTTQTIPVVPAAKPNLGRGQGQMIGGQGQGQGDGRTSLERTLKASVKGTGSDCPFLKGMLDEISQFNAEMLDLKRRVESTRVECGQEERDMAHKVDELAMFTKEIVKNTEHNNREINELKSGCLELFAMLEDSRLQTERNKDRRYLTLLKQRSLDPVSARK